jgi:hypothetical protein
MLFNPRRRVKSRVDAVSNRPFNVKLTPQPTHFYFLAKIYVVLGQSPSVIFLTQELSRAQPETFGLLQSKVNQKSRVQKT